MVAATRARWGALFGAACLTATVILGSASGAVGATATSAPEATATDEPTTGAPPWVATELTEAEAITSGLGRFVAVGSDGTFPSHAAAWTSADGATWQAGVVTEPTDGSRMTHVLATSDGYVALGTSSSSGGSDPDQVAAWSSPDGNAWAPATVRRPARSGLGASVRGVADGPAGVLALAEFFGQDAGIARLWLSADGATWEPVDLPGGENLIWHSVVGLPDGYLLLGQRRGGQPSIWRSTDGQAWDRVADAPRLIDAAVSPDGTLVGVGQDDIWRTTDLATWESTWTTPEEWALDGQDGFLWADWDGSVFAVAGLDYGDCLPAADECQKHPLLVSTDGITWTEATGSDVLDGPERATWLAGVASLDGATVVLGQVGGQRHVAWLVEGGLAGSSPTG